MNPKTFACVKQVRKTRGEAVKFLTITKQRVKGYDGRVYFCAPCGGYHIGRTLGRTRPAKTTITNTGNADRVS